jgi:hypothetical protein
MALLQLATKLREREAEGGRHFIYVIGEICGFTFLLHLQQLWVLFW